MAIGTVCLHSDLKGNSTNTLLYGHDLQLLPCVAMRETILGGSPGLVVMGDDSCSKGHGFESQRRILDGHLEFFHIDLL